MLLLPENFNFTNYIIEWYSLLNTLKLADYNSTLVWNNNFTSNEYQGKCETVNVGKIYTLSDTLEWMLDKDTRTNFVVWITNDGNKDTSAKTLIYSNQTILPYYDNAMKLVTDCFKNNGGAIQ